MYCRYDETKHINMKDLTKQQLKKRIETLMQVRKDAIKSINAYQHELRSRDTITKDREEEYKVILLANQINGKTVYETE